MPGGALSRDGERWVACRRGFFLPVRVLARLFRNRFVQLLQQAYERGQLQFFSNLHTLHEAAAFQQYLEPLKHTDWVVYAKAPLAGPQQVLDYLGRYTHRVAIANHRLLDIEHGKVSFHYKDYRHGNRHRTMTVDAGEFMRRFLLHVLPIGLQRIRYYGFLGTAHALTNSPSAVSFCR